MELIKRTFNERNLVVILFVLVLVVFSLAQRETKKLDKMYTGFRIKAASPYVSSSPLKEIKNIPAPKTNPSSN